MTIDEAIRCERKRAEESRDMYVCLLETSYQYQIKHKEEMDNYKQSAEEHEQLAEWLEELQNLKAENTYLHDEMQAIGATMGLIEKEIRNKAIDDFVKLSKEKWIEHDDLGLSSDFFDYMDEIAQQLKDGGTDG